MSAWHREHPEFAGTALDPWMANDAYAQATLEAHQRRTGFGDAWIAEQEQRQLTFDCEACGEPESVYCEWNGRDHVGSCTACDIEHLFDPDPPGSLFLREPDRKDSR
jgi:hypothetical protein